MPCRDLIRTLAKACGLDHALKMMFRTTIWEDNTGALTLANLDPGQMTPRSKFYDSKVHWFRSHLGPDMKVEKVDTTDQLADLFTKPVGNEHSVVWFPIGIQRSRNRTLLSYAHDWGHRFSFWIQRPGLVTNRTFPIHAKKEPKYVTRLW